MARKKNSHIPEPSVRRLPLYVPLLRDELAKGRERISCSTIATQYGFDPTQVRKDLAATGAVGTARVGFKIDELLHAIEDLLGWRRLKNAVLIGVGNLGHALLNYKAFKHYGISIVAAIDSSEEKIGWEIEEARIYRLEDLVTIVKEKNIEIGIITVPAPAAQEVADYLCEAGIKGIWNFAPVVLQKPDTVFIENVQLSTSLAVLTNHLEHQNT